MAQRARLADHATAEIENGVGTDDDPARVTRELRVERFTNRVAHRILRWGVCSPKRFTVAGSDHAEGAAELVEELSPTRRARRQVQHYDGSGCVGGM